MRAVAAFRTTATTSTAAISSCSSVSATARRRSWITSRTTAATSSRIACRATPWRSPENRRTSCGGGTRRGWRGASPPPPPPPRGGAAQGGENPPPRCLRTLPSPPPPARRWACGEAEVVLVSREGALERSLYRAAPGEALSGLAARGETAVVTSLRDGRWSLVEIAGGKASVLISDRAVKHSPRFGDSTDEIYFVA